MRSLARAVFAVGLVAVAVFAVAAYRNAEAACRMRPQCSVNADCDAICGVGQGHCVHSSCPVRICKCN